MLILMHTDALFIFAKSANLVARVNLCVESSAETGETP